MSNPYFTKSGYPATNARAVSASLRAEIANIEAGFDKLPTLSGNGSKVVAVNAGGTALEATATPNIGTATATSVNKVTITAPATSATLTIADGKTLTVSETTTLNHGAYTPTSSALVGCSAAVPSVAGWKREGGEVTVHGEVTVTASVTNNAVYFEIDLPVASNFTNAADLSGSCHAMSSSVSGYCRAVVANDTAIIGYFNGSNNTPEFLPFHFTYTVK